MQTTPQDAYRKTSDLPMAPTLTSGHTLKQIDVCSTISHSSKQAAIQGIQLHYAVWQQADASAEKLMYPHGLVFGRENWSDNRVIQARQG